MTDLVLIIGKQQDIGADYTYDISDGGLPGTGRNGNQEVYGTTLHYAPCHVEDGGFRCVVVASKGTNTDMEPLEIKNKEDNYSLQKQMADRPRGGRPSGKCNLWLKG